MIPQICLEERCLNQFPDQNQRITVNISRAYLKSNLLLSILFFRQTDIWQLYQAIRDDKNEELLRKLILEGKLNSETNNKEGMTPLLLAVDCEFSLDTLKFLVEEQNCSVSDQDLKGRTPLHYAADLENNEIMTFLLQHGANPLASDLEGSTPL